MLSNGGMIDIGESLKAGIYFLTYKRDIVYVGKSKELLRRLYEHRLNYLRFKAGKKGHPYSQAKAILFDGIMIIPCNPHDLDRLERQYIALHQPKHNAKLKDRPHAGPIEIMIGNQRITVGDSSQAKLPAPGPVLTRRV